ncbi:MAG: L-ribulose-5-phosphate 4-epimerase AraD [Candidatus Solibacter usitatus]|nr:L-ribulose-5-phosphate 4-epimerase AraD [Candidatus Solibacter usitatus]
MESLRREVLEANLEIVRRGLVMYTFGNASGYSPEDGLVAIKPSGVPFDKLRPGDMVVTDLDGKIVEGTLRPSSDLDTHLEIYRSFEGVLGVVHTHSTYAVAWAQARREIPCFGTTHADYFHGSVPVTEALSDGEIEDGYERNIGRAIVRRLEGVEPLTRPGILVASHGPFAWGASAAKAAMNAVLLEEIARMAALTLGINGGAAPIGRALHDQHFLRKHGPGARYGQG